MNPRGIIVLEGADASGKTTLAQHFREKYGARYVHLGLYDDIWRWHLGALWRAIKLADHELVVIDRHWISECAYGQVYRTGSKYPVASRCMDRVLMKHGAVYVLCVPSDYEGQLARHHRLKGERQELYHSITGVVQFYADLRYGNVAQPGFDYCSQLARRGEFYSRPDVMMYDIDTDGSKLKEYCERVVDHVGWWRGYQYPVALESKNQNLTGHAYNATHVIVGEAPGPGAHPRVRWPFVCNKKMSAAVFMNQTLHKLDVDETKLIFTNATGYPDNHLRMLAACGLKFICLGRVAEREVTRLGHPRHVTIVHPQHARRFGGPHDEAIRRYARVMEEALR